MNLWVFNVYKKYYKDQEFQSTYELEQGVVSPISAIAQLKKLQNELDELNEFSESLAQSKAVNMFLINRTHYNHYATR